MAYSAYPYSGCSPAPATPCERDKPRLLTESQWLEDFKKNHETSFQTQGCQSRCRQEPSNTKYYSFCHRLVNKDLVTTINQMPKPETVTDTYTTGNYLNSILRHLRNTQNTYLWQHTASNQYGGAN